MRSLFLYEIATGSLIKNKSVYIKYVKICKKELYYEERR